jgi:3-hydroxyacyl-CoA dehydrogenase
MGGQIAWTIASAGLPVLLSDVRAEAVRSGLQEARGLWSAQVKAGKLDAGEAERRLELITAVEGYAGFGGVDFVVEAVPERIELKQAVFAELDAATPGHAVLASNTSSLSITEIGEATTRPELVVGFHYFYPASMMRLIEVVEGEDTAPETVARAMSFAAAVRKTPIHCAEAPGFVVNRILTAASSELWRHQEESGADYAEVDRLATEGGAPIGPFRLADLLGLDTVLHVAEHLHDTLGDRFHVHAGMRELVAEGHLGVKTGRGFYEH